MFGTANSYDLYFVEMDTRDGITHRGITDSASKCYYLRAGKSVTIHCLNQENTQSNMNVQRRNGSSLKTRYGSDTNVNLGRKT